MLPTKKKKKCLIFVAAETEWTVSFVLLTDEGKLLTADMETKKIYLDYNATTPVTHEVIKSIHSSLINDWGNPSSGHVFGSRCKASISDARLKIGNMIGRPSSEIIFTSGGTEANNMIICGIIQYFEEFRKKTKCNGKPHIITTNIEHDSVLLPIKHLAEQSLADISIVKVDSEGCVNVEYLLSYINDNTCLITVMLANNETGVIMPVAEIGNKLSEINEDRATKNLIKILYHTDAAQVIGKEPVKAQSLNVDYITVVGHKFYGPRIGCVWAKVPLYPIFYGGGQENNLRPGTENTPMIVGLGKAAELVTLNLASYRSNMIRCRSLLEDKLKGAFGDDVVINCELLPRLPNTTNASFRGEGLQGRAILARCETLIASVGAACHGTECSQVLINSGVPKDLAKNAIRLSVGRTTTSDEIELVVADLVQAVQKIKNHL